MRAFSGLGLPPQGRRGIGRGDQPSPQPTPIHWGYVVLPSLATHNFECAHKNLWRPGGGQELHLWRWRCDTVR
jgi:hypothetical protein